MAGAYANPAAYGVVEQKNVSDYMSHGASYGPAHTWAFTPPTGDPKRVIRYEVAYKANTAELIAYALEGTEELPNATGEMVYVNVSTVNIRSGYEDVSSWPTGFFSTACPLKAPTPPMPPTPPPTPDLYKCVTGQCKAMHTVWQGGVTISQCNAVCHPAAPASSLPLGLGLGLGLPAAAAVVAISLRKRPCCGRPWPLAPGAQARAAKTAPEVEMGANPGIDVAAGANAL